MNKDCLIRDSPVRELQIYDFFVRFAKFEDIFLLIHLFKSTSLMLADV